MHAATRDTTNQEITIMTNTTQTSELKYCETCGTMLVMGDCRRCNPATKATRPKNIKSTSIPKDEIHAIGVDYVVKTLIDQGISTRPSNDSGIDIILDTGKTVLVRAMSDEIRVALINAKLDTIKADYLIITTNLRFTNTRKICIMTTEDAKNMSIPVWCKRDNQDEYFINKSQYINYKNNYDILRG